MNKNKNSNMAQTKIYQCFGVKTAITKETAHMIFMNKALAKWKVENYQPQFACMLLFHNVPFTYSPDEGMTFDAPELYVIHVRAEMVEKNGLFEPRVTKVCDLDPVELKGGES